MAEIFKYAIKPVIVKGFELAEIRKRINAPSSACKISNSGIYMRDKSGKFVSLGCVAPHIDSKFKSCSCKSARKALEINIKQKNCIECYNQVIENFLDRKYIDSMSK